MTPDQARMLQVVYDQLTGNDFAGWPTWQGGTEESLTLVDYGRRSNVEVREVHRNLNNAVHPKLDALGARVDALARQMQAGAGLTADQVRAIIAEALASTAVITITTKETPA